MRWVTPLKPGHGNTRALRVAMYLKSRVPWPEACVMKLRHESVLKALPTALSLSLRCPNRRGSPPNEAWEGPDGSLSAQLKQSTGDPVLDARIKNVIDASKSTSPPTCSRCWLARARRLGTSSPGTVRTQAAAPSNNAADRRFASAAIPDPNPRVRPLPDRRTAGRGVDSRRPWFCRADCHGVSCS